MRAIRTGLAAVVVLGLAGSLAHADPFFGYPPPVPVGNCNPGFYTVNGCGCWYGPNYCFQGPCLPPAPFNGLLAIPQPRGPVGPGPLPPPTFPMHPFAHGPRDFFMYGQAYND